LLIGSARSSSPASCASAIRAFAFHRFACVTMIVVMSVQESWLASGFTRAAEVVSATASTRAERASLVAFERLAARSERFLRENFPNSGANVQQRNWDGKGAPRRAVPKPEPQETQEERKGRVARVEISPREATIAAGQEIHFIASLMTPTIRRRRRLIRLDKEMRIPERR